jgi:hypothetical protein
MGVKLDAIEGTGCDMDAFGMREMDGFAHGVGDDGIAGCDAPPLSASAHAANPPTCLPPLALQPACSPGLMMIPRWNLKPFVILPTEW